MNALPEPIAAPAPAEAALVSAHDLELWREAMAQLRHMNEDVWAGVRLFLSVNSLLVLMVVGIVAWGRSAMLAALLVALLCALGIPLTLAARYLFKRQRVYYLQTLAKKALLDDRLGLFRLRFDGSTTDLALPWRLTPEVVQEIKRDFPAWVQKSVRGPVTMARVLFLIYEMLLVLYGLGLVAALAVLASRGLG